MWALLFLLLYDEKLCYSRIPNASDGSRTRKISMLNRARIPFHHTGEEERGGIEPPRLCSSPTVFETATHANVSLSKRPVVGRSSYRSGIFRCARKGSNLQCLPDGWLFYRQLPSPIEATHAKSHPPDSNRQRQRLQRMSANADYRIRTDTFPVFQTGALPLTPSQLVGPYARNYEYSTVPCSRVSYFYVLCRRVV